MIKKITSIFILFLIILNPLCTKAETDDFSYEEFINQSKKYETYGFNIEEDTLSSSDATNKLISIVLKAGKEHFKNLISIFIIISTILIISSLLGSLISSEVVADAALFGCYIVSCTLIGISFKSIAEISVSAINDIREYMNISFPGYTLLLASSGYGTTATSLQGTFIIISNIIAVSMDTFIVPVLYSSAVLAIANGVSKSDDINNFIKILIKSVKYIIGIMLTIFSAIISFTGFATSATDGIAVKTAKYAVANFLPVVGGCLAETLSSVIYTSALLKNTVGYIGIFVILIICIIPITKIFITSFIFKCLAFTSSILSTKNISGVFDTLSAIVSTFASILTLLSVIFILITGIIASIGV